jgi:hypothetical protein
MLKVLFISLLVGAALAVLPPSQPESVLISMGPDPGGKTGQGVTSESTRTDHAAGDKAIQEKGVGDRPDKDRTQDSADGQKDQKR